MSLPNRTLVIGDIHGGLKALQQVWSRAHISKEDTLVFLGDYVDGWSDAVEVISFLISIISEFITSSGILVPSLP